MREFYCLAYNDDDDDEVVDSDYEMGDFDLMNLWTESDFMVEFHHV